jgi:membrane protease subunit (stomatin/prohibitin family)
MSIRYRKHLILPTINQDEVTGAWFGTAHIQYTDQLKFHNIVIQGHGIFWTRAEAEKHLIQEAKKWIDSRLRSEHGNS